MSDGHYICVDCHEYIRTNKGERTLNAEKKFYRDSNGNYHTYYTKRHANPVTCNRRRLDALS